VLIGVALMAAGCTSPRRISAKTGRTTPTLRADVLADATPSRAARPDPTLPAVLSVAVGAHESSPPPGHDPRDDDPDFGYTPIPGDVYAVPGEFEAAQALILAFADDALELLPRYVELIEAGQREARVVVLYNSDAALAELQLGLSRAGVELLDVTFEHVPLDSAWIRDYGPVFALTKRGDFRIIDTRYYGARMSDDVVPTTLGEAWGFAVSRPPLITEGGNLLSDGLGLCVVSDEVLARNNVWEISELEDVYASYFGCGRVTVVPALAGEGTGHVDMLATITGPAEAIVGAYRDGDDLENAERLDEAAALMLGAGFRVRRIPMPTNQDGRFRSYTNALALNGVVFVPVYSDDRRHEAEALRVFADAYPGRRIVPIDATDLIQWSGAVHCITLTVAR
jgi:agmatine deiminase